MERAGASRMEPSPVAVAAVGGPVQGPCMLCPWVVSACSLRQHAVCASMLSRQHAHP